MEHHEGGDEDMVMELAHHVDEFRELTADSEQELKDVEDKVWWADGTDELEFRRMTGRRSRSTQCKFGQRWKRSSRSWSGGCASRQTWRSAFV